MFSLLSAYSNLEYVRIYVIYRVTQAEYVIRIRMAVSQKYVNIYSTHGVSNRNSPLSFLVGPCGANLPSPDAALPTPLSNPNVRVKLLTKRVGNADGGSSKKERLIRAQKL